MAMVVWIDFSRFEKLKRSIICAFVVWYTHFAIICVWKIVRSELRISSLLHRRLLRCQFLRYLSGQFYSFGTLRDDICIGEAVYNKNGISKGRMCYFKSSRVSYMRRRLDVYICNDWTCIMHIFQVAEMDVTVKLLREKTGRSFGLMRSGASLNSLISDVLTGWLKSFMSGSPPPRVRSLPFGEFRPKNELQTAILSHESKKKAAVQ